MERTSYMSWKHPVKVTRQLPAEEVCRRLEWKKSLQQDECQRSWLAWTWIRLRESLPPPPGPRSQTVGTLLESDHFSPSLNYSRWFFNQSLLLYFGGFFTHGRFGGLTKSYYVVICKVRSKCQVWPLPPGLFQVAKINTNGRSMGFHI